MKDEGKELVSEKRNRNFELVNFLFCLIFLCALNPQERVWAQQVCTPSSIALAIDNIETFEQDEIDKLADCGAAAVPYLINALSSSDEEIVYNAINVLYLIGPVAQPATDRLIDYPC